MTAGELLEWQAYERVEPWGERRQDLRAGRMMALVANALRPLQGLRPPPGGTWTAADFYPSPDAAPAQAGAPAAAAPRAPSRPARQTPAQMEAALRSFFSLTR